MGSGWWLSKMFKSKSFYLNHELDTKPQEHGSMYDSIKTRWMKYFVILLLIGFALLLVLSNVDFKGQSSEFLFVGTTVRHKEVVTSIAETKTTKAESPVASGLEVMEVALQHTNMDSASALASGSFICKDNISCQTVVCTGGPIHNLIYVFEDEIFKWCSPNAYYDVILENCTFYGKTIGTYTMSGKYKLQSLTIRNCILESIADNAFNYATVQNLINLTIESVQLRSLNSKSFEGLKTVNYFKLLNIQEDSSKPLTAKNFFQPMASNLRSLVLQQTQKTFAYSNIYDPTDWLGGSEVFTYLTVVNLNGTNFNCTLNRNTFANLWAVQQLSLATCGLQTIGEATFEGILKTLQSLDLRDNQLQILDGEFIATAAITGTSLYLARNQWRCDCNSAALIDYVRQTPENCNTEEPVCATPTECEGMQIRDIQPSCDDESVSKNPTTASLTWPIDTTQSPIKTTTFSSTDYLASSTATSSLTTILSTLWVTDETEETETENITDTAKTSTVLTSESTGYQQPTSQPTLSTTYATEIKTQTWTSIQTLPSTSQTTTLSVSETTTNESEIWTPSPNNYSQCYSNPSLKLLYCEKVIVPEISDFVLMLPIPLCSYNAIFNVYTTSSTSVQLSIGKSANGLQVTYFQAMTYNATFTPMINAYSTMDINDLESDRSYVFCVLPLKTSTTSPFDCRSAHLPAETVTQWLQNDDRPLFFAIAIFITICCAIMGMTIIYWLLRWRPTLICNSKRLRRIASTSYEVLLLPKSNHSYLTSQHFALNELRSSLNDTLTTETHTSNDYMQYYKNVELKKQPNVAYISSNRPPFNPAPKLPPEAIGRDASDERHRRNKDVHECRINRANKRTTQQSLVKIVEEVSEPTARYRVPCPTVEECENEYESLDYYQELY